MAALNVRRAPYKDFLQPALHRRFATTAATLLAVAYVQALILATWSSFLWAWFPLGPAGVRTSLLWFSGVAILVLRIGQLHVGTRAANTGLESFLSNFPKLQTAEALLSYILSAFLFSQVYLASVPESSGLSWLVYLSESRSRLNERPLFFTAHFLLFGILGAIRHLWLDKDQLSLGVTKPRNGTGPAQNGDWATQLKLLGTQIPPIIVSSINNSFIGTVASVPVYHFFVRGSFWRISLFFLRPFLSIQKTNMLPTIWPYTLWSLLRCFVAGFMLEFMWNLGNVAFSIFLVREPMKNGKPLTTESKDPNGSLLNGLKNKKLPIKSYAMWELAFIASDFEPRRKAIYEDIDRKDGPMWSQVYAICLDLIKGIETRIDNFDKKPEAPAPTPAPATAPESKPEEKQKLAAQPKNDPVFVSTPQKQNFRNEVEKAVAKATTSPGRSSQLSPMAKKVVAVAKESIRMNPDPNGPQNILQQLVMTILPYPIGIPFRKEYGRVLATTVLGSPYGELSLYVNAINALSQLVAHSLAEDRYGNVQRDVAAIVRAFTSVIKKLDAFKTNLPSHWTDVTQKRESPEVDAILEALRGGLKQLIQDFGPYSRDLRLSAADMRQAREAAQDASEMRQVP